MAENSSIEWTDSTWNPITGCSVVSPGCTNCYAMRLAARIERMSPSVTHYHGLTKPSKAGPVWTGKLALAPEATLTAPLRRRKPTMWFVNSMSDLFHEDVPDEWIDRVFAVMALAPQHTFQVLSKRAKRMREYMAEPERAHVVARSLLKMWAIDNTIPNPKRTITDETLRLDMDQPDDHAMIKPWPLPNVWLGVSAEDQRRADERIPDLLATPAAVRFVSAEPLLGPIDFDEVIPNPMIWNYLTGFDGVLDWVIVGGESGHGARPMDNAWAHSIVEQCKAAGVAVFVKQLSSGGPKAIKDMALFPDQLQLRQMPGRAG